MAWGKINVRFSTENWPYLGMRLRLLLITYMKWHTPFQTK